MRWFQGGIPEAVAASKTRNAIFVVFVEGSDDTSKATAASIESSDVSSKLESDEFVAIKLDSGSESYRQFAQIYQLVPVPSVFFIGSSGVPLEVVAGDISKSDLLARIDTVLEKCGKTSPQAQATSATSPAEDVQEPSTSAVDNDAVASGIPTKDEKEEHVKQLLELKRQQTRQEEEQAERDREIERRRVGQEVQKLRRWQQEQDLKELREQRQRDKAEDAAAKQRVLQQIAQDKAERTARFSRENDQDSKKQGQEEGQKEEPKPTVAHSEVTRIQFRLPDGSTHMRQFPATTALSEVRLYAATTLNMSFREFAMSTTFPRREFTASDSCLTMQELELVPTAVILILPAASTAVVSSPGYLSGATRMFWSLIAPLVSIFAYLRGLVFRGGGSSAGSDFSSSHQPTPRPADNSSASGPQPVRRRQSPSDSATIRRQGNVHRLTNRHDSSDDENNTWNGNSTQQM